MDDSLTQGFKEKNLLKNMNHYKEIMVSRMEEDVYPDEAKKTLCSVFEKVAACPEACRYFDNSVKMYSWGMEPYFNSVINIGKILSDVAEVDARIGTLVLLLAMTDELKKKYIKKSYTDEMFHGAVLDLRWQMQDCYAREGVWGIMFFPWYDRFFDLTRFVFGRLQFEMIYADMDYSYGDYSLKKGDPVINVHIPSSGALTTESCMDSFRQADEFFKPYFSGVTPFVCRSWLLAPFHSEILPESSNIRKFKEFFDIVDFGESTYDLARIFNKPYDGNPESLSEDNSLRRAYKIFLQNGGKVGFGTGCLLIKNGEILNRSCINRFGEFH